MQAPDQITKQVRVTSHKAIFSRLYYTCRLTTQPVSWYGVWYHFYLPQQTQSSQANNYITIQLNNSSFKQPAFKAFQPANKRYNWVLHCTLSNPLTDTLVHNRVNFTRSLRANPQSRYVHLSCNNYYTNEYKYLFKENRIMKTHCHSTPRSYIPTTPFLLLT